jgi:tetratricopeptide (TPR) repeat protein
MTIVKRLRLLTAILGGAAACAVVGTVIGDVFAPKTAPAVKNEHAAPKLIDELAKTRYTDKPTLAYRLKSGDTAFAWQLKPTLAVAPARPRDVLVMVDTSASQAGDPLRRASQIVSALSGELAAADRVDVWTVNLDHADHTRSLTGGFKPAADKAVRDAANKLAGEEYAAGAVDLKAGLDAALKSFERKPGRQQIVLFLGDGESAASATPLTEAARVDLGRRMADQDVQFFSVPLGLTISANTLHGFGMLTGGSVVRVKEDLNAPAGRFALAGRLIESFQVPVLKPDRATLTPAATELFPGQLPPLRADRPTLVVGTVKGQPANLSLTVSGTVAGQQQAVTLADKLAEPSDDHYFVAAMIDQWRTAATKDAPAVLAADRALAMAGEQFRLYRDEFLVLAMDAIAANRLDHAEKLFAAVSNIDPNSAEAAGGVSLIAKLRKGEVTKDQLYKQNGKLIKLDIQPPAGEGQPPVAGQPNTPAAPAGGGQVDPEVLVKQAQAAQAVAEAESRALVDETLRRVRTLQRTDPDGAYEDLKRQRENIRAADRLSDRVRSQLVADLESAMREVATKSAEIKRRLAAERERISQARYRLNEYDQQVSLNEQTQARLDRFRYLMRQAKFELAYREAQVMAQERLNRGLTVPPEVWATYRIGQSATQWREQKELRRLRDDRYLITMLQVDKSFVPYPDEPPVHFPPATVWRELRGRREVYEFKNQGVGFNTPQSLRTYQSILEGTHDIPGVPKRVRVDKLRNTNLRQLIELLENQFQKQIKFVVREDLFRQLGPDFENIKDKQFQNDADLTGVTLGQFLDVALLDIKASYIVRPEYIEITTMEQRIEEKVTRALEIGDLAFAAPNSINQQALQQNLAVFGSQLSFVGQAAGQAQFGFGGAQGFLGAGGNQGGGIGGIGQGGQQQGGGALGGVGNLGAQGGGGNLGVGGGILGTTGGQLGQFGNLGGQFGIQGNNQAQVLIQVIAQLVARGEWDVNFQGVQQNQNPDDENPLYVLKPNQLNSLGFYPVSNALIVRATSRYHPTQSFKLPLQGLGGLMQGPDRGGNRRADGNGGGNGAGGAGGVGGGPKADPNVMEKVNGLVGKADDAPALRNPATDASMVLNKAGKDPKKVWNETFDWAVTDPKLVVDAAQFLFEFKEYAHAAESLKANLRKGHATGAWAYEALTLALQASQSAPAEVERAALSGVDLDPTDPKAYLRAAKAQNDLGRTDAAIRLCQRAAEMEPNLPVAYLNALVYADKVGDAADVKTDVVGWATENLLRRDWPNDGIDYAGEAKGKVSRIVKKLTDGNRPDDAARLAKAVTEEKHRDLTVRLTWQGQADLDLTVAEPSGTTCSTTQKRTSGGGVLRSDILEQENDDRSELYTAALAFPGEYRVTVAAGLGKPIGNKAQVVVTKFAGTDKQEVKLFDVDLSNPKPIAFTLDGGTRTELATVTTDEMSEQRVVSTATPQVYAPTGIAGGFGGADASTQTLLDSAVTDKNIAPVVSTTREARLPSVSPTMPGFRVTSKVVGNKAEYVGTQVFVGKAVDIPTPKVPLLPGSGQ